MERSIARRAAVHAALGEPIRLAIVDDLAVTDRSPKELIERFDLSSSLLAHHLDTLESVGLIERFVSCGDRRRRYVRLVLGVATGLAVAGRPCSGAALFVCTHNSARSQLAAALWAERTGRPSTSAGTQPADRVHPGAVAAGRRAGLDLGRERPRLLAPAESSDIVVTVCDRAHEQLPVGDDWWHWSLPDPVEAGTDEAFDAIVAELDQRIRQLDTGGVTAA
jgi:protein-tyrosine-phosphatase